MSKAVRVGSAEEHLRAWVTDEGPCEETALSAGYRGLTVQVTGDLGGEALTLRGGITPGADAFITSTRVSPWLAHLPAVLFLRPETSKPGVTITVRGVL